MPDSKPLWSRKRTFLYAAIGAAVGLGNIWRFPYMAGENGGGAFLLIYLFFVVCLCTPLVVTELYIGQQGKQSPIGSMRSLSARYGLSRFWVLIGVNCLLISFLVFSFYSVIASWSMDYIASYLTRGQSAIVADAPGHFRALLNSAERLIAWQSLLIAATAVIVALGVRDGLERALAILVPGLFFILLLLIVLGAVVGDFGASVRFLLNPDFSRVTAQTWLVALGQAFFSVAIGGGAMMTYGAYLPDAQAQENSATTPRFSLLKMAVVICVADTLVALLAGFAIFPFVFANDIDPQAGAGLIFIVLPTAFAQFHRGLVDRPVVFCAAGLCRPLHHHRTSRTAGGLFQGEARAAPSRPRTVDQRGDLAPRHAAVPVIQSPQGLASAAIPAAVRRVESVCGHGTAGFDGATSGSTVCSSRCLSAGCCCPGRAARGRCRRCGWRW